MAAGRHSVLRYSTTALELIKFIVFFLLDGGAQSLWGVSLLVSYNHEQVATVFATAAAEVLF